MTEPSARLGLRRQIAAAVVIAIVVAASLVVALRGASEPSAPSSEPTSSTPARPAPAEGRDAGAIEVLADQTRAWERHDRSAYSATWGLDPRARRQAATVFANLQALRVGRLSARYVGADAAGLTGSEVERLGGDAWTAEVDVSWSMTGIRSLPVRSTLSYTFARTEAGVRVAAVGAAPGERTPVWLLGHLVVRRSPRTLAVATDPATAARLDSLLRQAIVDVGRVLPGWRGDLTSYMPSSRDQFDALVGAAPRDYQGIAAVTTTVDGSHDHRAMLAIVVNPEAFGGLGPVGAQVVLSHEATHAATDATTVDMPLWVAEGFADYVGVGAADVPLAVAASAAIRDVRRFGVPRTLPTDAAFRAGERVEAMYEEAWLAFRLMAQAYGGARVVAFYQDVVRHPHAVRAALRNHVGVSQEQLTRKWRLYLRGLAGTG